MEKSTMPTISMPNSYSNKPGFYDTDLAPTNNRNITDRRGDATKNVQGLMKKTALNGTNENSKRFVQILIELLIIITKTKFLIACTEVGSVASSIKFHSSPKIK